MTHLKISRNELQRCIVDVSKAIDHSSFGSPSHLHFEAISNSLSIHASSQGVEISTSCYCEGDDVRFALPPIPLSDVLGQCDEKIDLEIGQAVCILKSGQIEVVLTKYDFNDLNRYKTESSPLFTFDYDRKFVHALRQALNFAGKDDLRKTFTRILVEVDNGSATIVSTEGHMLFMENVDVKCIGSARLLLDSRIAQMIPYDDGQFQLAGIHFTAQSDNALVSGINYESESYPDYQKVIPQSNEFTGKISCKRLDLLAALGRLDSLIGNQTHQIKLQSDSNEILIQLTGLLFDIESIGIYLKGIWEGNSQPFGIDRSFLTTVLMSLNSEFIVLNIIDPRKAIIIEGEGQKRLIMPSMLADDQ